MKAEAILKLVDKDNPGSTIYVDIEKNNGNTNVSYIELFARFKKRNIKH